MNYFFLNDHFLALFDCAMDVGRQDEQVLNDHLHHGFGFQLNSVIQVPDEAHEVVVDTLVSGVDDHVQVWEVPIQVDVVGIGTAGQRILATIVSCDLETVRIHAWHQVDSGVVYKTLYLLIVVGVLSAEVVGQLKKEFTDNTLLLCKFVMFLDSGSVGSCCPGFSEISRT